MSEYTQMTILLEENLDESIEIDGEKKKIFKPLL